MKKFSSKFDRLDRTLHIGVLAASLLLITVITVDAFVDKSFVTQPFYRIVQLCVCLFFLVVFFTELYFAPDRRRYWLTHWALLAVSIPYFYIADLFGMRLQGDTEFLLRFLPLVRSGYALTVVIGGICRTRTSKIFVSYLSVLIAVVYFSSLIFFVLENGVNTYVTSYGTALWWAFMNVTTVGCEIYAVTVTGKFLSVLLAAAGMLMFPIFTVYITHVIDELRKKEQS